jgi:hypothetical protein
MDAMRRAVLLLLVPALVAAAGVAAAGGKKPKKKKTNVVGIVELTVVRVTDNKVITVDGRVRNLDDEPLEALTLVFHFLGPDGDQVTQSSGQVSSDVLAPGEEAEFHWQMSDHPRAVEVRVEATGRQGFELKLDKPGPYAVE